MKKFKFPTAFTVLAAVLLLVWIASFFVPAGAYKKDADGAPVPGTYHKLPSCSAPAATAPAIDADSPAESGQAPVDAAAAPARPSLRRASRASTRPSASASSSSGMRRRTASTASRPRHGVRRALGGGLPLRLGHDLPVRPRRRRLHHRDDEDRGDPDRHRPARAPLPAQRLGPDRDPDGGLRARRHELRHVGGDARLLRPARPARARAALRPDRRGGDHLPRRRHGRDRLDGQPVLDRRRLGRGRDHDRRRDRPADRDVVRARHARDRLRDLVRAADREASPSGRSSASRRPTPPTRRP